MGATQPKEIQSPNLITDFEFHLFHPNGRGTVTTKAGPQSNLMQQVQSDEINLGIQTIIKHGDTYNASLHRKYSCLYCCCTIPFIVCIILFPFSIVYFISFLHSNTISIAGSSYSSMAFYSLIVVIIIILIIVCYCYCCSYSGAKKAGDMWRDNIIQKINDQMQDWQSQWPQMAMTLIYPIFSYRRTNKGRQRVVDIRGIVRVSKGAVQFVNMPIQNVPIYQQYVQQPLHSEMVALNVQQPQVMIQNANGHKMMVQGQKAIVNGREVLLVQQPLQQHHQQQHVTPAISDHSSVNGAIPLSTEQGIYHNNDAPPAYNPNINQHQNNQEQNEGGATFS